MINFSILLAVLDVLASGLSIHNTTAIVSSRSLYLLSSCCITMHTSS